MYKYSQNIGMKNEIKRLNQNFNHATETNQWVVATDSWRLQAIGSVFQQWFRGWYHFYYFPWMQVYYQKNLSLIPSVTMTKLKSLAACIRLLKGMPSVHALVCRGAGIFRLNSRRFSHLLKFKICRFTSSNKVKLLSNRIMKTHTHLQWIYPHWFQNEVSSPRTPLNY